MGRWSEWSSNWGLVKRASGSEERVQEGKLCATIHSVCVVVTETTRVESCSSGGDRVALKPQGLKTRLSTELQVTYVATS